MWVEARLQVWERQNLMRQRQIVKANVNDKVHINFSSNDYLGLMQHPTIASAFSDAIKKYGFGSGASAMVSGYSDAHSELEQQFEKWLKVDRTILFNSGYLANIGVISSLVNRSSSVLSDRLCHASILEGIQLSRAKHYRYQHCNSEHLQKLAETKNADLIVTESVFSMEGDIAPITDITEIAAQHQSKLIIDDAHGIGVLGRQGGGICEELGITQDQFTCLVLPLGKAFNGMGAIVAGKNEVIETILQFSNSYRYTTSLPPAVCIALQASLNVIMEEQWRREQLKENIKFFIHHAVEKKLTFTSTAQTPIKSLIIGDNDKALKLQSFLLAKGYYVAAIRPPTVPKNTARLRISLNCLHTEAQIVSLLNCIREGIDHA
jgi:8-amino-7-oxononanoate synthase